DHVVLEQLPKPDRPVPMRGMQRDRTVVLVDERRPRERRRRARLRVEGLDVTGELGREPEIVVIEQRDIAAAGPLETGVQGDGRAAMRVLPDANPWVADGSDPRHCV